MLRRLEKVTHQRNTLVAILLGLIYAAAVLTMEYIEDQNRPIEETKQVFTPKDFIADIPHYTWVQPVKTRYYEMPWLNEYFEMQSLMWNNLTLSFEYIETEYIGRYFITAYSPEECGYNGHNYPAGWRTSTDTICHYSGDWREPTTCAIDTSVRKYGEYIMVGDPSSSNKKIYHCEDCGPGVKGQWVDCFVPNYDMVISWNTRYDNVYLVRFKTKTLEGNLYKTNKIMNDVLNEILMPTEIEYYKFGE